MCLFPFLAFHGETSSLRYACTPATSTGRCALVPHHVDSLRTPSASLVSASTGGPLVNEYKSSFVWSTWWQLNERPAAPPHDDERTPIKRYDARLAELACDWTDPRDGREQHSVRVCFSEEELRSAMERLWLLVSCLPRAENLALKAANDHLEQRVVVLGKARVAVRPLSAALQCRRDDIAVPSNGHQRPEALRCFAAQPGRPVRHLTSSG